jgi:hypothetical protein
MHWVLMNKFIFNADLESSHVNPDFVNPEIRLSGQNFRDRVDKHVILVFIILDSFIRMIC